MLFGVASFMHVCTLTSFHFLTVSASALETVIILSTLEVGPRVDKIFKAESILEGVESVRIVNVLVKLEKLPEIIRLWGQGKVRPNSNHFKNLDGYTLTKSLFNNKSLVEKVEVLEQLVGLLTDCANRKMNTKQITDYIDNLY